ncbi:MAG TPA: CBS domain-containing protein [Bdellovibrionales bacterium]|nr:CBS domain-containing protein [Bdellovibrionales bacterium]
MKLAVRHLTAEKFMTSKVLCVTFAMTVEEVIQALLEHKISGAPVIDQAQRLVSVVSESDLIRFAASGGLKKTLQTFESKLVPTAKLVWVLRTDPFALVFKKFLEHKVRRILVTDGNGKVIGIISRSNVLRAFLESESKAVADAAAEAAASAVTDAPATKPKAS